MSGYDAAQWTDFAVAVAGAAAALSGLLVVAASINIARIMASPGLPARTGQTLVMFATPLVLGVLLLVPEQPDGVLGAELITVGVVAAGFLLAINGPPGQAEGEPRTSWLFAGVVPPLLVGVCLVLAGIGLIGHTAGGLYWLAPAVLVAFLAGPANTWVPLIEILR